jgi:hypothetical protein
MVPPGLVADLWRTTWPVTQRAPGLRDLVGDGVGLGDLVRDPVGDGLGDLDGLGLLLADGLVELFVWLGLEEPPGLSDAILVGLEVGDGLGLFEGLALWEALALAVMARRFADSTASELCPHGDAIGSDDDAKAGAIVKPDARNDPAAKQITMRPARMTPRGTGTLRSSGRLLPRRADWVAPCPQA